MTPPKKKTTAIAKKEDTAVTEPSSIIRLSLAVRQIKPIGHGMIPLNFNITANSEATDEQIDTMAEDFKRIARKKIEKPTYDEIEIVINVLQALAMKRDKDGEIEMLPQRDGTKAVQYIGKPKDAMRCHARMLNCIDRLMAKGKDEIVMEFHQHRDFAQPNWDDMKELAIVMNQYFTEQPLTASPWLAAFMDRIADANSEAIKLLPDKK